MSIEIHVLDGIIRVMRDDEEIFDGLFDSESVDSLVDILSTLGFEDVDVIDNESEWDDWADLDEPDEDEDSEPWIPAPVYDDFD